ncbi:MAG: zinc ribbon domain-containing protein [Coriobacteriia bacterium]|nr:zinc ribbon domain-containing protein [Coriobacteriia bacterium]
MGELLEPIITHPAFIFSQRLCVLFAIILHLALVFWTFRDATHRGAMAWLWALAVFPFPIAGLIVYLVARPPEFMLDARERDLEIHAKEVELSRKYENCAACFKPIESDFLVCPHCMKKLRNPCVECGRALKLNWGVCPYCKTRQP